MSARWLWDEARHFAGADGVLEMHPGWHVRCHPAVYRSLKRTQLSDPAQRVELAEFIAHCSPDLFLFDLGAHFGMFSLAATHFGGAMARAVAVEPSPMAGRMLTVQAELNGVADRLRVVHAAVGATRGWMPMLPVGVMADGYFVAADGRASERDYANVRVVTIDYLAEDLGVIPTHIKIDVEGAEAAVLGGAQRVLAAHPAPILFIELHNAILRKRGDDPRDVVAMLTDAGYARFHTVGRETTPENLTVEPLVRFVARKSGNSSTRTGVR